MEASEIFAANLTRVMESRSLNITALAKLVGIARPTMSDIIHGKENVTLNRANRIAKAVNIPLSQLVEEDILQSV